MGFPYRAPQLPLAFRLVLSKSAAYPACQRCCSSSMDPAATLPLPTAVVETKLLAQQPHYSHDTPLPCSLLASIQSNPTYPYYCPHAVTPNFCHETPTVTISTPTITSTPARYPHTHTGTSMAAPMVAGAAALVWSAFATGTGQLEGHG